jgi:TRAP-type C4-dicarboxylate transport system permease small subunit
MPKGAVTSPNSRFWAVYARVVRGLVHALALVSALGIVTMMLVTCAEVILRLFRVSLTGVYDIVCISGAITMAAALPYTTACKGHVAIEFFFQRLPGAARVGVDAASRIVVSLLFGFLALESVRYGMRLREVGQVTSTLEIPEFWLPYVLAGSCAVTCLVKIYHLFHPGKELIKP